MSLEAPEEDYRWNRLVQGWKSTVDAFCASEADQGIGRFLHYAALAQSIDALPRGVPEGEHADARVLPSNERVALMTVHGAKGLQ